MADGQRRPGGEGQGTDTAAEEGPESPNGSQEEQRRSLPEKVTLIVSVLIVVLLMGYIGWYGLFRERGMPVLSARVLADRAQESGGTWTIPVELENRSNLPLEDVKVKVEMTTPGGERADTELEFTYLAERARETAFVVSSLPPNEARPEASVESFKAQRNVGGY